MTGSLRSRLLLGTVAATAAILAASAMLLFALVRAGLYAEFDAALGAQARALTALVEQVGTHFVLEFDAEQFPEYTRSERPEYFCFWTSNGSLLYRSPSLAGGELERIAGPPAALAFLSIKLPDGRHGRSAGVSFSPRIESVEESTQPVHRLHATVVVARDTTAIDHRLAQLAWLLVAVCGSATLATMAVMGWFTGHLLRPVDRLAARIAALNADGLAQRVDIHDVPAELRPVVQRLDELLARLEAAFVREKSFTADAAHELRTPLAGLRTTLEVTASRPREAEAYRIALGECLSICAQMQALVDNLLSLARLEAGKVTLVRERVAIARLIADCWKPFAERAAARHLRLTWEIDEPAAMDGDREKLRLVLHNLFDNAVSYADEAGAVVIHARLADGRLAVRVANSGCALAPDQASQVFDRFWRGDAARTAAGVHCGLGLALCRKLVVVMGGAISAEVVDGHFIIALSLPA